MAVIKARKKYDNPLEALKSEISNKPLFSEYDWKQAMDAGQLDQYSMALINSDKINIESLYKDYDLLYSDPSTRFNAVINEALNDRTKKTRQVQQFDSLGNAIMVQNDKGENVPLITEEELSDYDYSKRMIRMQNQTFRRNLMSERAKMTREEGDGFTDFLGTIAGVPMNLVEGVYLGVMDIGATLGALEKGLTGDKSFGQDFIETLNLAQNSKMITDVKDWMRDFEYNYTFYMDDEGNYNTGGQIASGVAESIGKMIPSMIIGKGVGALGGVVAKGLGAGAEVVAKTSAIAGQVASSTTFYSTVVFAEDVNQQYEYFKSQGITPPTAQILYSSAIKAALQYGVEFGLGKLLGTTGMDKMIFNRSGQGAVKTAIGKTLGKRAVWSFAKDALQEGLEESLQETTDFLVNAFMHNIVNHSFDDVKWDWETVGLSFVMGAISSIGMGGAQILGTKRVQTGNVKTTKSGEIVDGKFERLGKFASWQFGQDMESYAEAFNELKKAGEKLNTEEGKKWTKAQEQFAAAYEQSLASLQLILDLYGEVGREKFTAANEMLRIIKTQIDDGTFDADMIAKAQNEMEINLSSLAIENNLRLAKKMKDKQMTKIEGSVKEGETAVSDDKSTAEALENLQKQYGVGGPETIIATKDGTGVVRDKNVLVIPKNLLLKGDPKVIIESDAEATLVNELVEGVVAKQHYFKNALNIITDLYSQWSNDTEVTEEKAILTLIFDSRFYEAVLSVNEKITANFLLRLNTLVKSTIDEKGLHKKILTKKINECRKRWTDAALHFYTNNLIVDADEFTSSLTAKDREVFNKRLRNNLQLYNMGKDIILSPDKVPNKVWEFMERRINSMDEDVDYKTKLISDLRSNDSQVREKAITEISDYYDGAFMTLYDGNHYLSKTSFTNEIFNAWLENNGLYVYQLFDENYLTTEDINALGNDFTKEDIIQYRKNQLSRYNDKLALDVVDGNIVLKSEINEDGFIVMQNTLKTERAKIVTGEKMQMRDDKINRKIATNLKVRNSWLKSLLQPDIMNDYMADWFTVDDIVNHPEYLSDSVQDIIQKDYGVVDRMTTYRFIGVQLANETEGKQSLVMTQDGTVKIGDMTNMGDMYLDGIELPTKGQYNLSKFVKEKYLTGVLANVTVRFVKTNQPTQYVDYEYRRGADGEYTRVFVNEIQIAADSQSQMRFSLIHEVQHALQVELRMNQGIGSRPLEWFDPPTRTQIIKNVLTSSPELFADLAESKRMPNEAIVIQRVNDYIYYGSGETQAMGLGGVGQLSFYPVRVTRKNGMTTITFKNGKSFTAKNEIDPKTVSQRTSENVDSVLQKDFKKYDVPKAEQTTLNKMLEEGKKLGKLLISLDGKASDYQEFLYYSFGCDGTLEDFLNREVIIVEFNGEKYVAENIAQASQIIKTHDLIQQNDNVKVTISRTPVKNISSYMPFPGTSAGTVSLIKNNSRRGKQDIIIDLSKLPPKVMPQSLDDKPMSDKDFLRRFNINKMMTDFNEVRDSLIDAGYKEPRRGIGPRNIKSLLKPYENNKELYYNLYDYLYRPYGQFTDPELKNDIISNITEKDRIDSIRRFATKFGLDSLDFETLINLELPVVRYQSDAKPYLNTNEFVSVNLAVREDALISTLGKSSLYYGDDIIFIGHLIVGKIKLKDCLLVLDEEDGAEIFVPYTKIENANTADAAIGNYNANTYLTNISPTLSDPGRRKTQWYDITLEDLIDIYTDDFEFASESGDFDIDELALLDSLANKTFSAINKLNEIRKDQLLRSVSYTLGNFSKEETTVGTSSSSAAAISIRNPFESNYFVAKTIVHELIHQLSVLAIDDGVQFLLSKKIPKTKMEKAGAAINIIYENLMKNVTEYDLETHYGLISAKEMVAELANPDFVEFLKSKQMYGNIVNALSYLLGKKVDNVYDATSKSLEMIFNEYGNYQSMISRNQYLEDISVLKDYGIYEGLLYEDGKRVRSKVSNLSGILVLDSESELMVEIKKSIKALLSKKYDVSTDEALANAIQQLAKEYPKVFDQMMIKLNNRLDMSIQSILFGNKLIVLDNQISNYTIDIGVIEETKIDTENKSIENEPVKVETNKTSEEIKKEPSEEGEIEVYSKKTKRRYKNKFVEIDRRTNTAISMKDAIASGRYDRDTTSDYYQSHGYEPEKVITKKDANKYDLQLVPLRDNVKYVMREFIERRIYNVNGEEKTVDIYAYYKPKKYDVRGWTLKEELETNVKYFIKTKKGQKQLKMNPSLRRFLVESTGKAIDPEIQKKIESGKLTIKDLEEYILKENADLTTFKLVANIVYENDVIQTPQDLKRYALDLAPKMAAIHTVVKGTEWEDLLFNPESEFGGELTPDLIESIWLLLNQQSQFSEKLASYLEGFNVDVSLHRFTKEKNHLNKDGVFKYSYVDADVFDKQLYHQMMNLFDGTVISGSHAAKIARFYTRKNMRSPGEGKWNIWGGNNIATESLSKTVGEDKEGKESTKNLEDLMGDDGAEAAELIESLQYASYNKTLNEIRRQLLELNGRFGKIAYTSIAKVAYSSDTSSSKTTQYFENYRSAINSMTEEELLDWYQKFINSASDKKLRQIFFMAGLSTDSMNLFENYDNAVKNTVEKIRSNSQFAQRIYRKVNTIKNNVSKNNWKYVLKENGDIFNEDLSIKETALKETDEGKLVWRTESEMEALNDRLKQISSNAKNGVYDGADNFKAYMNELKSRRTAIKNLSNSIAKLINQPVTSKGNIKEKIKYMPVAFETFDGETTINVKDGKIVPKILTEVLSVGFDKTLKDKVKNLSIDGDEHVVATMTEIYDKNYFKISSMSEDEAVEFLEFYVNNGLLSIDSDASRLAIETQRVIAAILLGRATIEHQYTFSDELTEKVRKKLNTQASYAGQSLANENLIKKILEPNKTRAQMISKELGIALDEEDTKNLNSVLKATQRNPDIYKQELKNFETTLLRKYKGSKRTLWSKLLTFERAMMLSSPGTWLRNLTSNVIVVGGNKASEDIGYSLTNIFSKVFPKSKKALADDSITFTRNTKDGPVTVTINQYNLRNEVTDEIKRFIKNTFIDSGLMTDTMNGMSKYNIDLLDHNPAQDNILDMTVRSIAQNIHRNEVFAMGKFADSKGAKFVDKYVLGTIYKAISDDPFIKSRTKRYLGKILAEDYAIAKRDNPKLTFDEFVNTPDAKNNVYGISTAVSVAYAKAVNLAAADFMHSPNMVSGIERFLRTQIMSEGAWFAYKQIMPFAASSWAWCVEAMRYTPAGLISSIVKLAKLENTVAKAYKAHSQGKSIISSEFARYAQIRNLGKGTIGTALFIIGAVLAGFGLAGLDEEDDGYKLFAGDVKVAIDDILASQSIMMGIALISNAQKESDAVDVLSEICNQLFRDSLLEDAVSTFRYSSGPGEFLLKEVADIPSTFMPNLLKSIASVAHHRGVIYSDKKFFARMQKWALQLLPLPAEAVLAETQVDPYTGKTQSFFTGDFWESLLSRFTPIDISLPAVGENELEAASLDVRKSSLKGLYTIGDEKVTLSSNDNISLNVFYGKLNDKDLTALRNNRVKVNSKTEDGKYKELYYRQMTDKQKKAAIETIMSDNSQLAKIYILTSNGDYKYYATESEYNELRKLGITRNIYRKTDKLKGFVKS